MSDDVAFETRTCPNCGFPVRKIAFTDVGAAVSPCPYCGQAAYPAYAPSGDDVTDPLRLAFYRLPLQHLFRLKRALRAAGDRDLAADVSPPLATWVSQQHDVASAHTTLATIVDVLLTLHVISEEHAPPDQLSDVVVNVVGGRLHRLPLPRRGPCFCDSGKRFAKCHGRDPA